MVSRYGCRYGDCLESGETRSPFWSLSRDRGPMVKDARGLSLGQRSLDRGLANSLTKFVLRSQH